MATAPIVPAITLIVGQQIEITLTVSGAGSGTVWLSSDAPTVATPLAVGGVPQAWPAEVTLNADSGTFSLEGSAPGMALINFQDEIDPPDPETSGSYLGSVEVIVLSSEENDPAGDGDDSNEPMSIPEPIIILLVPMPPAGGPI